MASTTARTSPLQHWSGTFEALAPAVVLREVPYLTQFTIRVAPGQAADVAAVLGGTLPTSACTATRATSSVGELDVLWLGPDEYLVVGPADCQPGLAALLTGTCAALVDTSAQRTTLHLSGPYARDVLRHGCAIDLRPSAAPDGTCVSTLLARAGVVLVVRDARAGVFTVLVRASFADYLATWLVDASTEYVGQARSRVSRARG